MIDKPQNVMVFEIKGLKTDLAIESMLSRPYSNLALTKHATVPLQVCGLDRIIDEQNIIQTEEFIAFSVIKQSRVENKKLIKNEVERIKREEMAVANEYKDQLDDIAFDNVASRLAVKTETIDIIVDLTLNRVYALGSSNLILKLTQSIAAVLECDQLIWNPLFKNLENIGHSCRGFAFWLANRATETNGSVAFRGFKNIGETETVKKLKGSDLNKMAEIGVGFCIPSKDEVIESFRFKIGSTPVIKDYALASWIVKSLKDAHAAASYATFLRDNIQKIESLISDYEKDTLGLSLMDFMGGIAEEIKYVG